MIEIMNTCAKVINNFVHRLWITYFMYNYLNSIHKVINIRQLRYEV